MILTLLKSSVSLFYRLFLNLNLSDLSHDYTGVTHLTRTLGSDICSFRAGISGGIQFLCFITSDINLDHLDKVMSSTVFYDKCMIFQFVINKCLVGLCNINTLRLCKYTVYIIYSPINFNSISGSLSHNYYSSIYLMIIFIFSLFSIYSLTEISTVRKRSPSYLFIYS